MIYSKNNYRDVCVIALITLILYFNSLFNGFVWDDKIYILKDSTIANFNLFELLFSKANGLENIPMCSLTLAIDHFFWGFNPFGFHLTNFIIYVSSAVVLYFTIIKLPIQNVDTRKVALLTSIVFVLHPIHTEPVSFISGRAHLLAFFFVLLSLYWFVTWLNSPQNSNLFLSALFFILSLLSKQSAVAFPIFVLTVVIFYKNSSISIMQRILAAAGFILIDIISVFIHLQNAFNSSTIVPDNLISNSNGIINKTIKTINIYSFYIHKFIFPSGLTVSYDDRYLHSGISISSGLSFVLLLTILTGALYCYKDNITITIGLAWYSIMIVPAMNLLDTSPVIADRYGLIPTIGLSLVIGYIVHKLNVRYFFSKYIAIIFALILSIMTITRNFDWKSDYTLFKSALEQNPYADRTNYAEALLQQKKYPEALSTLKEEMDLTGSHHYYYYLGNIYAEKGNYQEAIKAYKSALLQNGDTYKLPHLALAKAYFKTGDDLNAITEYLNVIESCVTNQGKQIDAEAKKYILILQSKFLPDIDRIKLELAIDNKNIRLLSEIGLLYQKIGMYDNAIEYYDKLIKIEPANWIAWHNKALCLSKKHNLNDSVIAFEQSFLLNGKNAEALNQIGSLYMKSKDYSRAETYFKKAISVDQSHVFSVFNLARVYFSTGKRNDAKRYFAMALSLSGNSDSIRNRAATYLSKL